MTDAQPALPLTFLAGPWRLSMGLNALDLGDWLLLDERYAVEMAERRELIESRLDDVHAMLPEAAEGSAEVLELIVGWLALRQPQRFERAGEALVERESGRRVALDDPLPLRAAGSLVQEDLCLMQKRPDGAYALTGAVLCFPAHWRLREKLGLKLADIHAPVPGFAERLGGTADRFFTSLAVQRPVWRANWSLTDDPTLPQPYRGDPVAGISAENAGQKLWLRVERQTLRRLPRTLAVLFTIRTFVRPLAGVAADPAGRPWPPVCARWSPAWPPTRPCPGSGTRSSAGSTGRPAMLLPSARSSSPPSGGSSAPPRVAYCTRPGASSGIRIEAGTTAKPCWA